MMNLMMVGSLNTYTQNMKMQMKWERKKASGDYSSDGTKSIEEWLQKQAEGTGSLMDEDSKQTLARIELKMNAGKSLTSAEMEYLRKNDPETYKKAKSIEMERKAYEQRLKSCKTKEEVQRVKASQMAASLDRVNEVKNNPNIPGGKKLELIKQELRLTNASADTMKKFTESGEYVKLPTEAEQKKAEKDLKEAKEAEQKKEKPDAPEKSPAEKSPVETDVSGPENPAGGQTGGDSPDSAETPKSDADKTSGADIDKAKKTLSETPKTRAAAEWTPQARKVRYARARAAYAQTPFGNDASSIIDIKK